MASLVTTAFVLAAGMGTRMRPLTDNMPKPMVRLKGKPLIDHVLDRLALAGIERAVVNVHHYPDVLIQHLAQRTQPKVIISDERDELRDTGGGVTRALPMLGADPFIIHNSDCVWIEGVGCNLTRMIECWDPDRMDSLMLLATPSHSLGYDGPGDFNMDADGRLSRRGERRVAPFAFTGVSIAHPRMFDGAPLSRFSLNRLWDVAINRGRLFGLTLDGVWMHVGTPDAVEEAERRIDSDKSR